MVAGETFMVPVPSAHDMTVTGGTGTGDSPTPKKAAEAWNPPLGAPPGAVAEEYVICIVLFAPRLTPLTVMVVVVTVGLWQDDGKGPQLAKAYPALPGVCEGAVQPGGTVSVTVPPLNVPLAVKVKTKVAGTPAVTDVGKTDIVPGTGAP